MSSKNAASESLRSRETIVIGYLLGAGAGIGRHVVIDIRAIWGMRDYVDISEQNGNKLFQFSLGLTYMF
jgi:hypothetical protein